MLVLYCSAVLESWSDQGLLGTTLDVWVIDFKKTKLLLSICCSLFNMCIPHHVVCYCMVLVSSVTIWSWRVMGIYGLSSSRLFCRSHDRVFVKMEFYQPVNLPLFKSLKLLFLQSFQAVRVMYMMVLSVNSLTKECLVYSAMLFK